MQELKRNFRFWDFRVSHDQLLVRSAKNAITARNIDIAFVGVEYVELSTKIRDLRLVDAAAEDCRKVEDRLGRVVPISQVHVLETEGRRYFVVAAAMKVFESDLEVFESSLEKF